MSKAAVTVIRSLATCLILVGLAACETTTQRKAGEEAQSMWYEGFTHSDGRTFRPLTEDQVVWEVMSLPDPAAGIPGKWQLFLASMPDSLDSERFMSDPCPCCPDYHHFSSSTHDSLNPPCCVDCFGEMFLWVNEESEGTMLDDTASTIGVQPAAFDSPGELIIEALCEIRGVPSEDTALGVQLDIAIMGQKGSLSPAGSVGGHMRVMPQRMGADKMRRVLVRREFRIEPGQATLTLTGQNRRGGRSVDVRWRAIRANVYYDLK